MRIVVASYNPVKVNAVLQAFETHFPDESLEIVSVNVDSGEGDQPDSDKATRRGARTRARRAKQEVRDADFWVGVEGGIEIADDQLMAFAWMAVQGPRGRFTEVRSATLPLPPAVKQLIEDGMELGEANDRVFATVNSKQSGGAYGLLTNGLYTRESVYAQSLILALIPFVNSLYTQTTESRMRR